MHSPALGASFILTCYLHAHGTLHRHGSALNASGQLIALTPLLIELCAAKHPFHLHGHHFWALAIGMGVYDDALNRSSLNTMDPPYRDVINIPMGGYAVLRFEVHTWPTCFSQSAIRLHAHRCLILFLCRHAC